MEKRNAMKSNQEMIAIKKISERSQTDKVCILTSVHRPFDTGIFHKEAKSLARAGYDITLIVRHDKDEVVDIQGLFLCRSRRTCLRE
jgi:hypothetical protein